MGTHDCRVVAGKVLSFLQQLEKRGMLNSNSSVSALSLAFSISCLYVSLSCASSFSLR